MADLKCGDLTGEAYRVYEWIDLESGQPRDYQIIGPQKVFYGKGHNFHRVLDGDGIVHLVPAPGYLGCVIRWKPFDLNNPCQW